MTSSRDPLFNCGPCGKIGVVSTPATGTQIMSWRASAMRPGARRRVRRSTHPKCFATDGSSMGSSPPTSVYMRAITSFVSDVLCSAVGEHEDDIPSPGTFVEMFDFCPTQARQSCITITLVAAGPVTGRLMFNACELVGTNHVGSERASTLTCFRSSSIVAFTGIYTR